MRLLQPTPYADVAQLVEHTLPKWRHGFESRWDCQPK
jgi:hypothetical protein